MRTSTCVPFSGSRSVPGSLLLTAKYGLSALIASESLAILGGLTSISIAAIADNAMHSRTRPTMLSGRGVWRNKRMTCLLGGTAEAACCAGKDQGVMRSEFEVPREFCEATVKSTAYLAPIAGKDITANAPPPAALPSVTLPWCSSAISLTNDKPRPVLFLWEWGRASE